MGRSPEDEARVAGTTDAARASATQNMEAFAALVRGTSLGYVADTLREVDPKEKRVIAHIRGGMVGILVGDQVKRVSKMSTILEVPGKGLITRPGKIGEQASYNLSLQELRKIDPELAEEAEKALEAHRGRLRRGI